MTTAEPMTARGAHYTTLLETIDNQGATKLHAREREQLLEAADANRERVSEACVAVVTELRVAP